IRQSAGPRVVRHRSAQRSVSPGSHMQRQLIFLALMTALLLPFAWRVVEPFVTALLLAIIVAVLLAPMHARLARKLGRPGLAALMTTAFTSVLVLVAVWTVGAVLVQQVAAAYTSLTRPSPNDSWTTVVPRVAGHIADAVASRVPVDPAVLREQLIRNANGAATWLLRSVSSVLSGASAALATMLLMLLFLNELLRHGRDWVEKALPALPMEAETGERLV